MSRGRRSSDQARHQSQPNDTSATPATPNAGRCHQVPRLPRKWNVDVTKRHVCHAKCRGAPGEWLTRRPSTPPEPAQCLKCHTCHAKRRYISPSATPATQTEGGCEHKRHACHANGPSMSPSTTPATQTAAAPRATNGYQARHQSQPSATSATPARPNAGTCRQVPGLPRKWNIDVTKRQACHANGTSMSPSAMPATQSAVALRATNGDQARHQWQVPHLPRQTQVDVTKCHDFRANGASVPPSATPATQSAAAPRASD